MESITVIAMGSTIDIPGMSRSAEETVNDQVTGFHDDLAHIPGEGADYLFAFAHNVARVSPVVLLADSFGLDAGADGEKAFEFESANQTRGMLPQLFVHLHHSPFIENEGLHARHDHIGRVIAMPAVFAQWLVNLDDFAAVLPEGCPPGDIAQDWHIESKLARGLLKTGFHETAAKGLVGDFGLATQERVERNFFGDAGDFARKAQPPVVFIDPFIQGIGEAKAVTGIEFAREAFIKGRLDEVIGAKQVQVFGLRRKFECAIAVAEKPKVLRVADPLALDGLEFLDDFFGAISRAVIEHNEAVGAQGLPSDRLEGRADEPFTVVDRNDCDEIELHPL